MRKFWLATLVALVAAPAFAQLPNPYGASVTLDQAKKIAALSVAEAAKNNWKMAVAIVDVAGDLVYFEKMDGTQVASVNIAQDKARSSVRFKRPTKAMQDVLAAGGAGVRFLALQGAIPVEGGLPLLIDGKIVGAIGASGGTSDQDGLAAKAAGDTATATTKLGRAVQLAAQTGNEEATTRLRKVVDIDDQEAGTVRLKRTVEKADEMALDTSSTKTTRVKK